MDDEVNREPSAYALYRELKAAGVVSSVVSNGELLVAVDKAVPDATERPSNAAAQ